MNICKNTRLIFLTILVVLGVSSCLESEDLMTENAKTGGLIDVTSALQFKPGSTQSVDVEVFVYKGPTVKSINIYKRFTHVAEDLTVNESVEILLKSIQISEDNSIDSVLISDTFTWNDLAQGIPQLPDGYIVPSDPSSATVGDYFTLSYSSILSDGREVRNNPTTSIVVANFFAGYYISDLKYFHPTLQGPYPDNPYFVHLVDKELFTLSNADCRTYFALWEDISIDIIINNDNSVEFIVWDFFYLVNEGDPYDSTKHSFYDPLTRTMYLYYYFTTAAGHHVFWEVLSQKND